MSFWSISAGFVIAIQFATTAYAADFLGATVVDREVPTSAWRMGFSGFYPTIIKVNDSSKAKIIGFKTEDIILKANDKPVSRSSELSSLVISAESFTVMRDLHLLTLSLPAVRQTPEDKMTVAPTSSSDPPSTPILRVETGKHANMIRSIDVDRAGRWLVSASDDKTVRVWNIKTGVLERIIRPPIDKVERGKVLSVAISAEGNLIAAGILENEGASILLFSRNDGRLLASAYVLCNSITNLAFSPNMHLLAAMLGEGGLKLFTLDDFSVSDAHNSNKPALRLIAQDLEYISQLSQPALSKSGIDFSNDSSKLVTSYSHNDVRLYAIKEIDFKSTQPLIIKPFAKSKTATGQFVKFSPDDQKIAVARSTESLQILSSKNLSLLYEPDTSGIEKLSFKPGTNISSGENSGSCFYSVAWSPDGKLLYSSFQPFEKKINLRRWNDGGRGQHIDLKTSDNFDQLKMLPDGKLAFRTLSAVGILTENGKENLLMGLNESILSTDPGTENNLSVSEDGSIVKLDKLESSKGTIVFSQKDRLLNNSQNSLQLYQPFTSTLKTICIGIKDSEFPIDLEKLEGLDFCRSFAVAADRKSVLIGTAWSLRRFDKLGKELWGRPVQGHANAVNISPDRRVAIAFLGDGTIRWYDYATGRELSALFIHADKKRWVLWTPEGFFDHPPGGEELIGWHLNQGKDKEALFFPVSKLYKEFYRPDLVTASFEGKDLSAYAKTIDINKILNPQNLPPTVRFLTKSTNTDSRDLKISAEVCDVGGGVGDITLFLNEMPVSVVTADRGVKVVSKTGEGKCSTFERFITLQNGENSISLMAYNKANNIESNRDNVMISQTSTTKEKPDLHILAVAVDSYRDGDLRLKYAKGDAEELIKSLQKAAGKLFGNVHLHRIYNDKVTKAELAKTFENIGKQTKREDVFILFVAGHGITNDKDGGYYFLPVDFRYTGDDAIIKQGISMDDFKRNLANIQAMKSLILLDTCNSGSFAEAIASRGMIEKTAITKLSRAVGRATIVASSKNQVALEGYEGHGVFTWALMEGLNGKAADKSGSITINGIASFVEELLPRITYKKWGYEQIPQKTLMGMDFQIGVQ